MKVLLYDSSVLLNLLAADCLEAIANATGWQFAICTLVQNEIRKLRDPVTGEMVSVDLEPLIRAGLLQVYDVNDDHEQALYVEQASVVDDGEAMSIAIASNRRLELAIDDKQASNHCLRTFPSLKLWSTPAILKHWADEVTLSNKRLREAILLIEARARYFPARSHPLFEWWDGVRSVIK